MGWSNRIQFHIEQYRLVILDTIANLPLWLPPQKLIRSVKEKRKIYRTASRNETPTHLERHLRRKNKLVAFEQPSRRVLKNAKRNAIDESFKGDKRKINKSES